MRTWWKIPALAFGLVAAVGVVSASAQVTQSPVADPAATDTVIVQTPPPAVVQVQPPAAVVVEATPWCAGAYSPVLGSNFAPCPAAPAVVSAAPAAILTPAPAAAAPVVSAPAPIVDID